MKNISIFDALHLVGKRQVSFNRSVVSYSFDECFRCHFCPVECVRFWFAERSLGVLLLSTALSVALPSSLHHQCL